jgi:hypothetical protein
MTRKFSDLIAKMDPKDQAEIKARGKALLAKIKRSDPPPMQRRRGILL